MAMNSVQRWLRLEKLWNHLLADCQLRAAGARDVASNWIESERVSRPRRPVHLELELLETRKLFNVSWGSSPPALSPFEGTQIGITACFTCDPQSGPSSACTATAFWGDGTSSAGTVSVVNQTTGFMLFTHTYTQEPPLPSSLYTLTLRGSDGTTDTRAASVSLGDATITLDSNGPPVKGAPNRPLRNVVVGTFVDGDPGADASDFTGTIDWHDGATSDAYFVLKTRTSSNSTWQVKGSHTYTTTGTFTISASPQDRYRTDNVPMSTQAIISWWTAELQNGSGTVPGGFEAGVGAGFGSPENTDPGANGSSGSDGPPDNGDSVSPGDGGLNVGNGDDMGDQPPDSGCCDNSGAGPDSTGTSGGTGTGTDMSHNSAGPTGSNGFESSTRRGSLSYNSNTVNPHPIIVAVLPSDPAVQVQNIQATLTWDGITQPTVTYNAQSPQGATYWLPIQELNRVNTGLHTYSLSLTVNRVGGGTVTTALVSGSMYVVANDTPGNPAGNPYGQGWSLGGIDSLAVVSGGVYWVHAKTGGSRFFAGTPSPGSVFVFTSPANDFGTLQQNADGSYTYTALDQTQINFGSPGPDSIARMSSKVDAHGLRVTYTYSSTSPFPLIGVMQPDGARTTLVYSGGLLQAIQEPGSHFVTVTIDPASGKLTSIQNPDGNTRSFQYDSLMRLTNDQWGPTNTTFVYDSYGRASSVQMGNNSLGQPNNLTVAPAVEQGITSGGTVLANGVGVLTDALSHPVTYTLDGLWRLTKRVVGDGGTQSWIRNDAGLVITYTDGLNHTTTLGYSNSGYGPDRTSVNLPDGGNWQYAYDTKFHHLIQTTDPRNNITTYGLDSNGDVTTILFANNTVKKMQWSNDGLLQNQTDELNHTTLYLYDLSRRVTVTIDATGARTTLGYDGAGNVTYTLDANNHLTTMAFDGMRRMIRETDALGNFTTTTYNALGEVTGQRDKRATITLYGYDVHGWQTTVTEASGTTLQRISTTVYDAAGNVLYTQDPLLHITSYGYDSVNRQTTVISGNDDATLKTTSTMVYDLAGNLLSETDGISSVSTYVHKTVTNYGYDSLNRQTTVVRGANDATVSSTSTMVYDKAGNLVSETNGYSTIGTYSHIYVTSYLYDTLNRQIKVIQGYGTSLAAITTTVYDRAGNVLSTQDPVNNVTSFGYDADNRQNQIIRGYNNSSVSSTATMLYDPAGNLLSETDGIGTVGYDHETVTSYGYDPLNRQTTVILAFGSALASTSVRAYDPNGNLTTLTTGISSTLAYSHIATTQYAYDVLNRQTSQTDPLGHVTSTIYDADNNVIRTYDALNNATTMTYDALNRLKTSQEPSGGISTTVYDAASNVIQTIDQLGHTTSYSFDSLNRQTQVTDARNAITTTMYDAAGNTTQVISAQTTLITDITTFGFDVLNRQTTMTDALGHSATMAYDLAGRLTSSTDRDLRVRNFGYDQLNRKTSETWLTSSGGSTTNQLTFAYDAAGNLLTSADSHGTYTMGYDALNRITSELEPFGQSLNFQFDAVGNRIFVRDSNGGVTRSTYDAANRLTSRQFTGVGQTPVRADFSYTARDQLASITVSSLAAEDLTQFYTGAANAFNVSLAGASPTSWGTSPSTVTYLRSVTGDFNGDGLTDVAEMDTNGNWWVGINNGNNSFTFSTTPWATWSTAVTWTMFVGDFNGDGKQDIAGFVGPFGGPSSASWWVGLSNGSSSFSTTEWAAWNANIHWSVYIGDFNGDGLTDVVGFISNTSDAGYGQWWVGLSTGSSFAATNWAWWNSSVTWTIPPQMGDFNGDGMTDVIGFVAATGQWWVGISTGSSFNAGSQPWTTWSTTVTWINFLVGDFTGDGKSDIVGEWQAATQWWVGVSNGSSFTNASWLYPWAPPGSLITGDFNGDGRTDIGSWNSSTGTWQVAQSTGSSFTTMTWATFSTSSALPTQPAGDFGRRGIMANYGYDNDMRLTTLTYQQIGSGTSLASYAYGYDLGNRLTSENLDNGTLTSYGYDVANQLTTVTTGAGSTTYAYDLTGNRTTNTTVTLMNQLTDDGTYTYAYDPEGNEISKRNKSTGELITFAFDNLNHMISVLDKNSSGTTLTYATYVYDVFGNRIEKDVWTQAQGSTTTTRMAYDGVSVWADLDGSNNLLARYLRGDQVDQIIARMVASGSNVGEAIYMTDRLGSVRNLANSNGSLIDTITYDGFGNVTNETNSAIGDRWKFTGRELDSETGLQFNRARYLDQKTGRWTSQDPLGFEARDVNLYRYVGNSPTNRIDPAGKDWPEPSTTNFGFVGERAIVGFNTDYSWVDDYTWQAIQGDTEVYDVKDQDRMVFLLKLAKDTCSSIRKWELVGHGAPGGVQTEKGRETGNWRDNITFYTLRNLPDQDLQKIRSVLTADATIWIYSCEGAYDFRPPGGRPPTLARSPGEFAQLFQRPVIAATYGLRIKWSGGTWYPILGVIGATPSIDVVLPPTGANRPVWVKYKPDGSWKEVNSDGTDKEGGQEGNWIGLPEDGP
jgi:RHS repeat-associated protein